MKRLFNKVLVALSITMLVAGSANGMNYVTGFFNTATAKEYATKGLVNLVAAKEYAITKTGLAATYVADSRVGKGLATAGTYIAESKVGQLVAAHPTAFKVAGAVAIVGTAVGYLAKDQAKKLVNKFYPTQKNNNKQGGNPTKATFIQKYEAGLVQDNMALAGTFKTEGLKLGLTQEQVDVLANTYSSNASLFATALKTAVDELK